MDTFFIKAEIPHVSDKGRHQEKNGKQRYYLCGLCFLGVAGEL